jgi:hypothetical protein
VDATLVSELPLTIESNRIAYFDDCDQAQEAPHLNDNLQSTLNNMIQSGSWSNPAMNTLINDYTTYHVVLVVTGSFLVAILGLLSIFFGMQWRRVPKTATRKWTFEKKTYFSFASLSIAVGLLVALIVAVNATTVANPRHGFSLLVDSMVTPPAGTPMAQLYQSFNTWVQSDSANIPPLVQRKIDERMAFHTTRIIIAGILLIVFVVLSTGIWGALIKRSRVREATWRLQEIALLVTGVATVALSLLLMVIVMANMQGAIAPITMTLLYG